MMTMPNSNVMSKGKILLVDDDPGLLRLLSIRLRAEDYEVEAVESAEKALTVLTRFRPDLVITDLAHGQNGRHRTTEGTADSRAGTSSTDHYRARHDSRRGDGDAEAGPSAS